MWFVNNSREIPFPKEEWKVRPISYLWSRIFSWKDLITTGSGGAIRWRFVLLSYCMRRMIGGYWVKHRHKVSGIYRIYVNLTPGGWQGGSAACRFTLANSTQLHSANIKISASAPRGFIHLTGFDRGHARLLILSSGFEGHFSSTNSLIYFMIDVFGERLCHRDSLPPSSPAR